jgi:hypothetical protein
MDTPPLLKVHNVFFFLIFSNNLQRTKSEVSESLHLGSALQCQVKWPAPSCIPRPCLCRDTFATTNTWNVLPERSHVSSTIVADQGLLPRSTLRAMHISYSKCQIGQGDHIREAMVVAKRGTLYSPLPRQFAHSLLPQCIPCLGAYPLAATPPSCFAMASCKSRFSAYTATQRLVPERHQPA